MDGVLAYYSYLSKRSVKMGIYAPYPDHPLPFLIPKLSLQEQLPRLGERHVLAAVVYSCFRLRVSKKDMENPQLRDWVYYVAVLVLHPGTQQDMTTAVSLLDCCASFGHSHAALLVGLCHHEGVGVPQDESLAVNYYKLSADLGNDFGSYAYGRAVLLGLGTPKDVATSETYFQRCAEARNPFGEMAYGLMMILLHYCQDIGTILIKRSADQGLASGQRAFGQILWNDGLYGKANEYLRMAALKGDAIAQFLFGDHLMEGNHVQQNIQEGERFTKMSADQGHPLALNNYGVLLTRGGCVPVDLVAAAHYYKLSADQGHPLGRLNFASALLFGRGVPVDVHSACELFSLVFRAGSMVPDIPMGFIAPSVDPDRWSLRYFSINRQQQMDDLLDWALDQLVPRQSSSSNSNGLEVMKMLAANGYPRAISFLDGLWDLVQMCARRGFM
jgi:TPR repeat protein